MIVHQLTAIPSMLDMRRFDREFALTNRLRTNGTDYLLSAGRSVAVRRFVAQSIVTYGRYARAGGPVKSEEDMLESDPVRGMRGTLDAVDHLEQAVLGAQWTEGIVLRYGAFYGPGTSMAPGAAQTEMVRQRKFPLVGDGGGFWSFIHVADAADATVAAVERGPAGSTTWSTMTPHGWRSGCRRWPRSSARRSPCAYRGSSAGCSPARQAR